MTRGTPPGVSPHRRPACGPARPGSVSAPRGCGTVGLYDLSGRLVRTAGAGEEGVATMETGGLASGVYVVRWTGPGPQAFKVTVVH